LIVGSVRRGNIAEPRKELDPRGPIELIFDKPAAGTVKACQTV
jgi:hypothetical protein